MPARRILILTNRVPYPLNDGGNLAMDAMIRSYSKCGWQVYVLSMNTSRHQVAGEVLQNLYKDIYKFEVVDVNNDVTITRVLKNLLFSKLPNHAERFYHNVYKERLAGVLHEFKPNVVQVESIFLSTYLPVIKQHNTFSVLRMHNVEWQVWQRLANETVGVKGWYLQDLSRRMKVFEEQAWKNYNLLLPITLHDADVVRKVANTDMFIVPFGVLPKAISTAPENWVGYHIGAMDWMPNKEAIDWFISDIWPAVRQLVPDFQFFFAGRNMPSEFLVYNDKGLHCAGEVPDADAFIAGKKILIVPLRSGGGIRVKILEAMAAGKLVISTSVGMQGIEANPDEHYLLADDANSFALQIQWVMQHQDAATVIATNAKTLITSKYNADEIATTLSAKLSQALNR